MTTMRPRFKTGILAGLTLLAVTACGGGSSTLPMEINLDTPVPAAALEPVAALEPAAALEQIAASNQDVLDNAGNVGCEAAPEVFRQTMLELANAARVEARMCGLSSHDATGTLEWNNQLALAAAAHGRDMATNNFFAHNGTDGLSVDGRADAANYPWRAIGENIAAGQTNHDQVHQDWLDSPEHCRNIMNPVFAEVGAACVRNSNTDFGTYWVVVFGNTK